MANEKVSEALDLLGFQMQDKVTGYVGVVETMSFDLYGCVQAALRPPINEKGEVPEGRWFDVSRLVKTGDRVMEPPASFVLNKGPSDKSTIRR